MPCERRSGVDRRANSRPESDSKVMQEINQVKSFLSNTNENLHDSFVKQHSTAIGMLSSIPYVRRFTGVENSVENNDYTKAAGIAFLSLINLREDWNDILKIFKTNNVPNTHQIPFSFVRGTPLEKTGFIQKFGKYFDITLYDTKIGQKILNLLGKTGFDEFYTGKTDKLGRDIIALEVKGKPLAKIAGRTLMRMPVLGLLFISLLELPSICKAQNHGKQAVKSAVNVSLILGGGALLGAIGAFGGPLGSLVGLGVGSYLGSKLAESINKSF